MCPPSRPPLSGNLSKRRGLVLAKSFFVRRAEVVAQELLGKVLVRRCRNVTQALPITETEAYVGPHDKACHAHRGRTPRNAIMFGPAGKWYVYFCYGMHWMLNVVTNDEDYPAAVLFRAAGNWTGPGRLTKALQIDGQLNGENAARKSGLWIEDRGIRIPKSAIERTPRIGIGYAKEWTEKPLRFLVSQKRLTFLLDLD
jgi:DNA-3-methyladenine glycosylase